MLSDRELAWMGGLFDGEGCILVKRTLVKPTKLNRRAVARYSYSLCISIGMVHKPTVEKFYNEFGGSFRYRITGKLNHRTAWEWQLHGKSAKAFLELIEPYLFIKKEEALVGLAFANREMNPGGRYSNVPVEDDPREQYYQQLKRLKKYEYVIDEKEELTNV